jgi:mitochondrial-processing peptidase subunit alpha
MSRGIQENYTAPRMVLAGLGVEHDELVSIAEPLLADLTAVKRLEEPKSVYVGGGYRCQADSEVSALSRAYRLFIMMCICFVSDFFLGTENTCVSCF